MAERWPTDPHAELIPVCRMQIKAFCLLRQGCVSVLKESRVCVPPAHSCLRMHGNLSPSPMFARFMLSCIVQSTFILRALGIATRLYRSWFQTRHQITLVTRPVSLHNSIPLVLPTWGINSRPHSQTLMTMTLIPSSRALVHSALKNSILTWLYSCLVTTKEGLPVSCSADP